MILVFFRIPKFFTQKHILLNIIRALMNCMPFFSMNRIVVRSELL